jgi:hypothetical protein
MNQAPEHRSGSSVRYGEKTPEANQAEEGTNRYQRGWDAAARADWPDSAADTPGSAASTRANANWGSLAASQNVNITN